MNRRAFLSMLGALVAAPIAVLSSASRSFKSRWFDKPLAIQSWPDSGYFSKLPPAKDSIVATVQAEMDRCTAVMKSVLDEDLRRRYTMSSSEIMAAENRALSELLDSYSRRYKFIATNIRA